MSFDWNSIVAFFPPDQGPFIALFLLLLAVAVLAVKYNDKKNTAFEKRMDERTKASEDRLDEKMRASEERMDKLIKDHREEIQIINREHHATITRIADDYKVSIERVSTEVSRMREEIPSVRYLGSDMKDQNIRLRDTLTVMQQLTQQLITKLSSD